MVAEQIRTLIQKHAPDAKFSVERPKQEGHGDYASNVALILAKQQGKNPREVAEDLAKKFESALFESIEVAGPGFINFRVQAAELAKVPAAVLQAGQAYGAGEARKETAIIEYSSPNIAKRFSIGHLRSTIIGQVIYNLHRHSGWQVVGDNHIGDWGTQFGKMLVAIAKWTDKPPGELTIDELEALYVRFHKEAESQPELEDEARAAFAKLEQGDEAHRKSWNDLIETSMADFERIYDLLGVEIDELYGESYYEEIMPGVIEEAKKKGLAIEDDGALIMRFPDDELPPAMWLKRDGATTYFTRDMATVKFRLDRWKPAKIIVETGNEQSLHFQQVYRTAELLGWTGVEYTHVAHGLVRLKEGKISTRKGRTVKLQDVLDESMKRAAKINDDKGVAQAVGIGAVKYNDLKHAPNTSYTFDWDEMLQLEGNSGPYIQYVYARSQAVLRKAGAEAGRAKAAVTELDPAERELILQLEAFPLAVRVATERYSPNLISSYLFELTQAFNRFYELAPILKAEGDVKTLRLQLTEATGSVIKTGLGLLGIKAPERM